MKTLQTIQKTFHIFAVLVKIARIFSIVGAVLCGVGAFLVALGQTQWQAFRLLGEEIVVIPVGMAVNQVLTELLTGVIMLSTEAVLLYFAGQYLKTEQAEGTPFTENGAQMLKKLGIRCIYMPIVAIVIASVVMVCLGAEELGDVGNLPSVAMGITMILASLVFRYGAELEEQNRQRLQ